MQDLRELGPTYFFAPPRIFETVLTTVMIRMEDAGWPKRLMFRFFMQVARRCGPRILDGKPVCAGARLIYAFGRLQEEGPLKTTIGVTRRQDEYTAGAGIGPDIFDFYRDRGVNLKALECSRQA